MDWGFLSFLSEPWFVIPWYLIGFIGMAVVIYDLNKYNTALKPAMKWAWPIIVLFFSVIGLALYYGTARAPDIGKLKAHQEKKKAQDEYEKNMARRVNGAVIHCVAGDGLGIMTGMVIARAVGMSFWQEFWFEYLVGFLGGWLLFQYKSMTMMTDRKGMALAMAFRAEFFSMLTVMAGMGAVMGYVTPLAVTAQPKPLTYAFWGFGMLGLLVGYVFTFPMNWIMVKIGWKHGMGGMGGLRKVEGRSPRMALVTTMVILGFGAMIIPGWLAESREGNPLGQPERVASYFPQEQENGNPIPDNGLEALQQGVDEGITFALENLREDRRSEAMHALDAVMRSAEVGKAAAPGSAFETQVKNIEDARRSLHMGDEQDAEKKLAAAQPHAKAIQAVALPSRPDTFEGAVVINARGVRIGRISEVDGPEVLLRIGGLQNVWGFWDIGSERAIRVGADELVYGPKRTVGLSLVALPFL